MSYYFWLGAEADEIEFARSDVWRKYDLAEHYGHDD